MTIQQTPGQATGTAGSDLLKMAEVQRELRIGKNAAYDLVGSGSLRSVRVGRLIRVPRSAVEEFIRNGGGPTTPD